TTDAGSSPATFVVVRVGDPSADSGALSNASTPVFLEEYNLDGTLTNIANNPLPLPTAASGSNAAFTLSGTTSSEGALTLSADSHFLTLAGYASPPGVASIKSQTTVNRVIARVDSSFNVDTSTLISDGFTGDAVRGSA